MAGSKSEARNAARERGSGNGRSVGSSSKSDADSSESPNCVETVRVSGQVGDIEVHGHEANIIHGSDSFWKISRSHSGWLRARGDGGEEVWTGTLRNGGGWLSPRQLHRFSTSSKSPKLSNRSPVANASHLSGVHVSMSPSSGRQANLAGLSAE